MRITIVVVHLAGTGFNHKSLVFVDLTDTTKADEVKQLLVGKKALSRDAYGELRGQLVAFGPVSDGQYQKGMSDANPDWPSISFWPR